MGIRIVLNHRRKAQGIAAVIGKRGANQAATVGGHKVDGLRGNAFRHRQEIPFVFAVFVVNDNHHLADS